MKQNNLLRIFALIPVFIGLSFLNISAQGCEQNLLINGDASDGLNNWDIISTSGDGIGTLFGAFLTSYGSCSNNNATNAKSQLIDLLAAGYDPDYLDRAPEITIGEEVISRFFNNTCVSGANSADPYYVRYEIRDADMNVLAVYNGGTPTSPKMALSTFGGGGDWLQEQAIFSGYGPGARYVYFEHGGKDTGFWAGYFGAMFKDGYVYVEKECTAAITCPEDIVVTNMDGDTGVPVINITDPCCGNAGYAYVDTYLNNDSCEPIIRRLWYSTGSLSNTSCHQQIEVRNTCSLVCPSTGCVVSVDGVDPTLTGLPSTNSGCALTDITFYDTEVSGCEDADQIVRVWTAQIDGLPDCSKTCSQVISINDQTAPTLSSCPEDISVNTSADIVHWSAPVAADNCLRINLSATHSPGQPFAPGSTLVTYTAYDNCGNAASCDFMVVVLSEDATNCPEDQVLMTNENGAISWEAPEYMGDCTTCKTDFIRGYNKLGSYGGSAYYISKKAYGYDVAMQMATIEGGHLVSITSEEENEFLADKIFSPAFIGLNDSAKEGSFRWTSGESMNYENWYKNQPNDYNNQDYVELLPRTGLWNDLNDLERNFILEIPCEYVKQTAGPANGSKINAGIYTISYSIQDACGIQSACSFTVTVEAAMSNIIDTEAGAFVSMQAVTSQDNDASKSVSEIEVKMNNLEYTNEATVTEQAKFKIYPNPTSSIVNIEFEDQGALTLNQVAIINLFGQQVFNTTTDSAQLTIDLSREHLAKGTYIVIVRNGIDVKTKNLVYLK